MKKEEKSSGDTRLSHPEKGPFSLFGTKATFYFYLKYPPVYTDDIQDKPTKAYIIQELLNLLNNTPPEEIAKYMEVDFNGRIWSCGFDGGHKGAEGTPGSMGCVDPPGPQGEDKEK
jgi:hypothetical protein